MSLANDIFIISVLTIEIIIFIILGISTLKKSRSLANVYFSAVFFVIVGLSALNIVIRFLSIKIELKGLEEPDLLVKLYLDLVSIVTALMIIIFIIYGAGFYIINFGEKYYRDRKLFIVFIILVILVGGTIIGTRALPESLEWGFNFYDTEYYDEFFIINGPLAIYLGVISLLFVGLDVLLLVRILPDTESKVQKRKIIILLLVIISYALGLANLIVVDMRRTTPIPEDPFLKAAWSYLIITSILFLFSVILLYYSIIYRRKTEKS